MRRALLVSIAAASCWVGAAQAAPTQLVQRLAVLHTGQTVRGGPGGRAGALGTVSATTPITGAPTVLPVLRTSGDWLEVALPGRPNGHTGWIDATPTRRTQTAWRIVVDLSARSVTVYRLGREAQAFRAVVGKPSTPTPTGTFFVEEPVHTGAGAVGGPYALALSARSNVLQEFDGGPGQIAIHGRDNLGGVLGSAASHGCVRVADSAVRWLVGRVGAGTPVTIKP